MHQHLNRVMDECINQASQQNRPLKWTGYQRFTVGNLPRIFQALSGRHLLPLQQALKTAEMTEQIVNAVCICRPCPGRADSVKEPYGYQHD
jgi:hypothetical protein